MINTFEILNGSFPFDCYYYTYMYIQEASAQEKKKEEEAARKEEARTEERGEEDQQLVMKFSLLKTTDGPLIQKEAESEVQLKRIGKFFLPENVS